MTIDEYQNFYCGFREGSKSGHRALVELLCSPAISNIWFVQYHSTYHATKVTVTLKVTVTWI
jgi:hypothetical protein